MKTVLLLSCCFLKDKIFSPVTTIISLWTFEFPPLCHLCICKSSPHSFLETLSSYRLFLIHQATQIYYFPGLAQLLSREEAYTGGAGVSQHHLEISNYPPCFPARTFLQKALYSKLKANQAVITADRRNPTGSTQFCHIAVVS